MITAAGLCPWPPILAPELTGRQAVLPELRTACLEVVHRLLRTGPDVVAVVGPAAKTEAWGADERLDLRLFAPVRAAGITSMPLSLGLGAYLLDAAEYRGERLLQAVGTDEPAQACAAIGQELAQRSDRVALLLMGEGSARRNPRAPGHLDPRAEPFDAAVERALRTADFQALREVDASLADELMATGRVSWQVLSGAMPATTTSVDVLYRDDPFGVAYLVAFFVAAGSGDAQG